MGGVIVASATEGCQPSQKGYGLWRTDNGQAQMSACKLGNNREAAKVVLRALMSLCSCRMSH